MRGNIIATSLWAAGQLVPGGHGVIHSIYRRTVNLRINGQLLSLQSAGSPLSPISLISDLSQEELSALPLSVGQPVSVTEGALVFHAPHHGQTCRLPFSFKTGTDLTLAPSLSHGQLQRLQRNILSVLHRTEKGGFSLLQSPDAISGDLILQAAHGRLNAATALIADHRWEEAARQLVRLVGLGPGLTPSGDDFLTGVLAGLMLSPSGLHPLLPPLQSSLHACLQDTNDISAAFLRCALLGQFSAPVVSLTGSPSVEAVRQDFEAIGHSSGMDTLCGISYGLSILNREGCDALEVHSLPWW